ncbi:MAG TPA: SDR family oxidoreductase [Methylomirabilota bacterium]|nr:SDR family oxidoreductase [Methylomirabilota bacterium]
MSAAGRLQNKSIVIVGGTTGLGLSAAKAFAREGALLVVIGRKAEHVAKTQDALGDRCVGIAADATDPRTAQQGVEAAVREFGRLDALYHVAGGSGRKMGDGPLHEISDEGWAYTQDLNLTSLFYSNRAAVQQFLKQASAGVVLNMGSVLGWSPSPRYFGSHAYAAAKAAIIGMTKASAAYYAPNNIRLNVIAPALVETPMAQRAVKDSEIMDFIRTKQPLDGGRVGAPEDLDGAAIFLVSDESRFVTGQVFTVDGGWTVSEGQLQPE